MMKPKFC